MARTVNFEINKPDGTAWVGAKLHFRLIQDSYTDDVTYPSYVVTSQSTDASGEGSVELWQDETGAIGTYYEVTLPSGETFEINVPAGPAAIELSDLRGGTTPSTFTQGDVYRLSNYGSLSDAITDIGSEEATLLMDRSVSPDSNVSTPSTLALLWIAPNNIITPDSGVTVTINGPMDAGLYQTFDTSSGGSFALSSVEVNPVYPQWWGAFGDNSTDCTNAINSALAAFESVGGHLEFPAGTYIVSSEITVTQNQLKITGSFAELKGVDVAGYILHLGDGTGHSDVIVEGIRFNVTGTTTGALKAQYISGGLKISHNSFIGTGIAINAQACFGVEIDSNHILGSFDTGVLLEVDATSSSTSDGATVRNNWVQCESVAGSKGLHITDSTFGVVSKGNYFKKCASHGIHAESALQFTSEYDIFETVDQAIEIAENKNVVLWPVIGSAVSDDVKVLGTRCVVMTR